MSACRAISLTVLPCGQPALDRQVTHNQQDISSALAVIPPQKQMTGMLGHPVAENPIDLMFDAVYAHYGLNWQFWKNDVATTELLRPAIKGLAPLGYRGVGITVPYKVDVIPLLD